VSRRPYEPERCRSCDQLVVLAFRTTTQSWWRFDAQEVDPSGPYAAGACVLLNAVAYGPKELEEHFTVYWQQPASNAARMVREDYPWHRYHRCPNAVHESATAAAGGVR